MGEPGPRRRALRPRFHSASAAAAKREKTGDGLPAAFRGCDRSPEGGGALSRLRRSGARREPVPDRDVAPGGRRGRAARGHRLVLERLSRHGRPSRGDRGDGRAARAHGAGAGGTRNISGTHHPIVQLEAELADLHGKEAALVFTSGWISNLAGISTIASLLPDCLILSDALNHNSMIEGVRRSGCEKKIWRHNDVAHLEELLAAEPLERAKLIVFESLYSMDGDIAPIAEIVELAEEIQRDDLYRRGPRGRHVRPARRRRRRARRSGATHRRHRGHARQGLRLARRLYRGERGDHRRGAQLRAPVHLHLDLAAERRGARPRRCGISSARTSNASGISAWRGSPSTRCARPACRCWTTPRISCR